MSLPAKISLAKSPLHLRLDREEARKTGRFIALFALLYLVLSFGVTSVFPAEQLQGFIAGITASCFRGTVSLEENPIVSLAGGTMIEVSELCTGMTELFILAAAILASIGIPLKKRLLGAALGSIAVFALNIFRILATTAIILATGDALLIEFAHNVFFRAFLFISIAAIYIAWFYWAVRSEGEDSEKLKQNF